MLGIETLLRLYKYSNAGIFEHEKYRSSCVAKGKIPKV